MNYKYGVLFRSTFLSAFFIFGCAQNKQTKIKSSFNGLSGAPITLSQIGSVMFLNHNDLHVGNNFDLPEDANSDKEYTISENGKYSVVKITTSENNKYIVIECKLNAIH